MDLSRWRSARPAWISRVVVLGFGAVAQRPGAQDLGVDAVVGEALLRRERDGGGGLGFEAVAVAEPLEQRQAPGQGVHQDQRVVQLAGERQRLLVAGARPVRPAEHQCAAAPGCGCTRRGRGRRR